MPEDAAGDTLYVGEGLGRDGQVLVRVLWFKPSLADQMGGLQEGTFARALDEVVALSERPDIRKKAGVASGAVQAASGQYVELGTGVLPGGKRAKPCSTVVDGQPTFVPYSRKPAKWSDAFEPALETLMGATARMLERAFPGKNHSTLHPPPHRRPTALQSPPPPRPNRPPATTAPPPRRPPTAPPPTAHRPTAHRPPPTPPAPPLRCPPLVGSQPQCLRPLGQWNHALQHGTILRHADHYGVASVTSDLDYLIFRECQPLRSRLERGGAAPIGRDDAPAVTSLVRTHPNESLGPSLPPDNRPFVPTVASSLRRSTATN